MVMGDEELLPLLLLLDEVTGTVTRDFEAEQIRMAFMSAGEAGSSEANEIARCQHEAEAFTVILMQAECLSVI